jgi:hypothetical protein
MVTYVQKEYIKKKLTVLVFFAIIGERPNFERVISYFSYRNLQGLTANASLYMSGIVLKFEPKSNIATEHRRKGLVKG